jgi:hypothetical protein
MKEMMSQLPPKAMRRLTADPSKRVGRVLRMTITTAG